MYLSIDIVTYSFSHSGIYVSLRAPTVSWCGIFFDSLPVAFMLFSAHPGGVYAYDIAYDC